MSLLGDRLREARERRKLKQIDVKNRTNINNKTLSRYESGGSEPDYETLKLLAELYEVSIDWLTGLSNNLNMRDNSYVKENRKLYDAIARANELPEENIDEVANVLEALIKHHKEKVAKGKGE
jgi:transcriptional regulator with XRE-family HTH domain